jgi:hypothetical protein
MSVEMWLILVICLIMALGPILKEAVQAILGFIGVAGMFIYGMYLFCLVSHFF